MGIVLALILIFFVVWMFIEVYQSTHKVKSELTERIKKLENKKMCSCANKETILTTVYTKPEEDVNAKTK